MESALRGASVVLVVVTTDFLRSKFCLEELYWACNEMQRRSSQAQQVQQPADPYMLVPIFYHDQDPIVGFGVDSLRAKTLNQLLRQHHAVASAADRAQWLDALLSLQGQTGVRQDSTARCAVNSLDAAPGLVKLLCRMSRCELAHMKTSGQYNNPASLQSVFIWTRGWQRAGATTCW